jgi:hypothetical protein
MNIENQVGLIYYSVPGPTNITVNLFGLELLAPFLKETNLNKTK